MSFIYLVTYTDGDSVIDYGTQERVIGVYTTMPQARKARADFAKHAEFIDDDEYDELLRMTKRIYYLGYGSIDIRKLQLDSAAYSQGVIKEIE